MKAKLIGFIAFLIFLALGYYIFFQSAIFSKTHYATGYFHKDGPYCGVTSNADPEPSSYPELGYFRIKHGRLPISPEHHGIAPLIAFAALFDRKFCEKSTELAAGTYIKMSGTLISSKDGLGHDMSNVYVYKVSDIEALK